MTTYHELVKRLLDGELTLADLPPELHPQAREALHLVAALDREPVTLSPELVGRVMVSVRGRALSPARRVWRWLAAPRDFELRLRVRPLAIWGGAVAAAAALALILGHLSTGTSPVPVARTASSDNVVFVRFVLYAPGAKRVSVAGTFNQWNQEAAPLVLAGQDGVWTTTLALPVGQHQYAFVVDGERWVADPAAPAVGDGFGRRNSVIAVTPQGARTL